MLINHPLFIILFHNMALHYPVQETWNHLNDKIHALLIWWAIVVSESVFMIASTVICWKFGVVLIVQNLKNDKPSNADLPHC